MIVACASRQVAISATSTNNPSEKTTIPVFTPTSELTTEQTITGVLINLGPQGGSFRDLVVDPTTPGTLYALSNQGGVFKSTDDGKYWYAINKGLTDSSFRSSLTTLVIDPTTPTTLYVGAHDGELFKSVDGGENWNAVYTYTKPTLVGFYQLVIDQLTPTTLYATTDTNGTFKSTDGGETWQQSGTPKQSVFHVLAIDPTVPDTLYAKGYSSGSSGVYKTMDGGQTWNETSLMGVEIRVLVVDPTMSNIVYAGTDRNGLFKSTDCGEHWRAMNAGLPNKSGVYKLKIDSKSSNTLYAITTTGLFKSKDGGEHWRKIETGLGGKYISSLTISASGELYMAIYPDGIFKSIDSGETWQALPSNPIATVVYRMAIDPTTPTTFYVSIDSGDIFKSTDSGKTWRSLNTSVDMKLQVYSLVIDPIKPKTLYAGTGMGLFKSTDGGEHWSNKLPHIGIGLVKIDPIIPTTIYAAPYSGSMLKSVDGGEHWKTLTATPQLGPSPTTVFDLVIDAVNTNILYAGTLYGAYKSTDGGESWQDLKIKNRPFMFDLQQPNVLYAGEDGLFKSMDGGETWQEIKTGFDAIIRDLVINPTNPEVLYAEIWDKVTWKPTGLIQSRDGGKSWHKLDIDLPNTPVYLLAIDPSNPNILYLATRGRGLLALNLLK